MVLISFDVDKDEFAVFHQNILWERLPGLALVTNAFPHVPKPKRICSKLLLTQTQCRWSKWTSASQCHRSFLVGSSSLLLPGFAAIKTSPPATKCRGRHKMRQSGNILCPGTPQSSGTPKQVKAAKLGTSGDHKDNIAFKTPPPWSKYLAASL